MLAVAIHAIKRAFPGGDVAGKKVLILGAGTIGNLAAQSARCLGAGAVMITDISRPKLDMALACGVDHAVDTSRESLAAAILRCFGPDGADAVLECTANPAALNEALLAVGKGIPIVVVGVFAGLPAINLANVQDREYSLIGTLMYVDEDYRDAISLLEGGGIDFNRLITRRFDIGDIRLAYRFIAENKAAAQKIILEV